MFGSQVRATGPQACNGYVCEPDDDAGDNNRDDPYCQHSEHFHVIWGGQFIMADRVEKKEEAVVQQVRHLDWQACREIGEQPSAHQGRTDIQRNLSKFLHFASTAP